MKIHFTSDKERQPDVDQGIKVVYAPAKRAAYRLRWYLILLLVASPALWLAGSMVRGYWLIEAPAQTWQPLVEVRALESGLIRKIHVQPNQQVAAGELLATMDNPLLTARYHELRDSQSIALIAQGTDQQQAMQQLITRASQRVSELEQLVSQGAATRGELHQARDLRDERMAALLDMRQRAQIDTRQQQDRLRLQSEQKLLKQQLDLLEVRANENAIVRDVNVHEGEAAGPGTLIMRLQANDDLQIHVFLDARQRELAHPGQPLKLRMPDNSWLAAQVVSEPALARRLPQGMQPPFGGNQLGIVLHVATLEPLPEKWRLDNLQLTARFPNKLSW